MFRDDHELGQLSDRPGPSFHGVEYLEARHRSLSPLHTKVGRTCMLLALRGGRERGVRGAVVGTPRSAHCELTSWLSSLCRHPGSRGRSRARVRCCRARDPLPRLRATPARRRSRAVATLLRRPVRAVRRDAHRGRQACPRDPRDRGHVGITARRQSCGREDDAWRQEGADHNLDHPRKVIRLREPSTPGQASRRRAPVHARVILRVALIFGLVPLTRARGHVLLPPDVALAEVAAVRVGTRELAALLAAAIN
jgi:hypothetical protein